MPIHLVSTSKKSIKTLEKKGPNETPEVYFKLVKDLEMIEAKTCFAFDVSGSQQDFSNPIRNLGGKTLIKLMHQCEDIDNVSVYPFGDLNVMGKRDSIKSFNKIYYGYKQFNSQQTATISLNTCLKNAYKYKYNRIIILGDGEFRANSGGRVELNKFLDNLKNCDFSNIQELNILFSPHTHQITIEKLTTDVSNILGECQNAINFKTYKLPYLTNNETINHTNLEQFKNYIRGYTVKIPENYIMVGNLFTVHQDMTYINLANLLKKIDTETSENLIGQLFDFLKMIIINKPELLQNDSNIYGKIHNVLKLLLREEYTNWISLEKKSSTGLKNQCLTKLIDESYNKDVEYLQLINQLDSMVIGYLQFPSINITKNEILNIIKDGSCGELVKFLNKNIINSKFIGRKKTEKIQNQGMLIIKPPGKNENLETYKVYARKSLQTLFYQFGNYLLEGNRVFIAGLKIISTENLNIQPFIYESFKSAVFNDSEYSFRMLGFDTHHETLEIPDMMWNPPIMRLIAQCAISFPIELFGDMTPQKEELISILASFLKVQNMIKTFKQFSYEITTIKYETNSNNKIEVGDLVRILSWENEIQPNLPAVGTVLSIKKKKGIVEYKIEFLDKQINTDDTRRLTADKLVLLKKSPTDILKSTINSILIYLQIQGEKGNLGPDMKLDAMKTSLRDEYDFMITNLISYHQINNKNLVDNLKRLKKLSVLSVTKFVIHKMTDFTIRNSIFNWKSKIVTNMKAIEVKTKITDDAMLQILRYKMGINEELQKMLKHGTSFTKNTHINCSSIDYEIINEDIQTISFKSEGLLYHINKPEIETIITEFRKQLETTKIKGCLVSNIKQCPVCYTEDNIRNFSYYPECHHMICMTCQDSITNLTQYKPGDFVKPYAHQCTTCRHMVCHEPQIKEAFHRHHNNPPSNIKFRFCSHTDCHQLFEYQLHCGGDESTVPLYCEQHRIIDETAKNCPQCNMLVSKTEGCDHMECTCGAHWCWGCQYSFSENIIPLLDTIWWKCYECCDSNKEQQYLDRDLYVD